MKNTILAFYKRLLSYYKTKWELTDYPLRYKKHADSNNNELKPWVVQIINWWTLTGLGNTKEEAFNVLKENFEIYKKNNCKLPRPGCNVPLQYADTTNIDNLEDVAVDFFREILGYNYFECFISDQSSIIDFGKDDDEVLQKINKTYKLNLSEIGDGNIVRLLTLIKKKNDE
ncbi:MAG: hypothetical protein IPO21_03335 [Bacteroidales bacterium]|nr:hypothetical protein [Bacteroidales bacterium]